MLCPFGKFGDNITLFVLSDFIFQYMPTNLLYAGYTVIFYHTILYYIILYYSKTISDHIIHHIIISIIL